MPGKDIDESAGQIKNITPAPEQLNQPSSNAINEEKLLEEAKKLETQNAVNAEELMKEKAMAQTQEASNAQKAVEINQLKEKVNTVSSEIVTVAAQQNQASNTIAQLQMQLQTSEAKRQEADKALQASTQNLIANQQQFVQEQKTLEDKLSSLKAKKLELQNIRSKLEAEKTTLKATSEGIKIRIETSKQKQQNLNFSKNELTSDRVEYAETKKQINELKSRYSAQLSGLLSQIEMIKAGHLQVLAVQKEFNESRAKLMEKNKELQTERDSFKIKKEEVARKEVKVVQKEATCGCAAPSPQPLPLTQEVIAERKLQLKDLPHLSDRYFKVKKFFSSNKPRTLVGSSLSKTFNRPIRTKPVISKRPGRFGRRVIRRVTRRVRRVPQGTFRTRKVIRSRISPSRRVLFRKSPAPASGVHYVHRRPVVDRKILLPPRQKIAVPFANRKPSVRMNLKPRVEKKPLSLSAFTAPPAVARVIPIAPAVAPIQRSTI